MITAKPIRQSQRNSQPTREDYVVDEQNKRRWIPIAFLLFITGCAAYLKSFLPSGLEAREERGPDRADDDDEPVGSIPDEAIAAAQAEEETPVADSRSSDNVVPVRIVLPQEAGDMVTTNTVVPIDARPAAVQIDRSVKGDPVAAGNDNRPDRSGPGGGNAGGGGGGGGGGDASDPDPEADPPGDTDAPSGPDTQTPRNRAPRVSGPVYLSNVVGCETLMITVLILLAGASDPDGDQLSIVGLSSSSGTLTRTEDGSWIFSRDQGMLGEVALTYSISDGQQTIQQVAYFNVVEAPPMVGTDADDYLLGTNCSETIDGAAGDDNMDARDGNDTVIAGSGADHIVAGAGHDVVHAGSGNDVVYAGAGNDTVFGGSGNDRLFG